MRYDEKSMMFLADCFSLSSKATRLKVGAVIRLKDGTMISGVNGLPKPLGNKCEELVNGVLVTKKEVVHAEENALLKACRKGKSTVESELFVTHAPCRHCASMLISAGVKKVYFQSEYRDKTGVELLLEAGVEVQHNPKNWLF